jgi:hypothetical protein
VVYGPTHLGGLGLRHLFSESYTKKIETVVCHINAKTPLGDLFRINLNWYQQLLGSAPLVLLGLYKRLYVPSNWFTGIGHFLKTISAQIRIRDLWAPRLLRQHDRVLMDEAHNFAISLSDQKVFNKWRIYFRVTTLSQVSNAYGNYLLPQLLHPHLISQFNQHRRDMWPQQQIPDIKYFSIWKRVLLLIANANRDGKLSKPMALWDSNYLPDHFHSYLLHTDYSHILVFQKVTHHWYVHVYHHTQCNHCF